jgi:hypothetical protein
MKTLGKVVTISKLDDGEGVRVTKDFLAKVTKNLFQNIKNYCDIVNELPVCYQERQVLSLIGSAIQKVSPAFLGELPVRRSDLLDRNSDSHGWVDFWAAYRNTNYFIEVKHGFYSYRSKKLRSDVEKKWDEAVNQLNSSKLELEKNGIYKNNFLISLMVMPFYVTANGSEEIEFSFEEVKECNSSISKQIKSNWSCLCYLHKEYVGPYDYMKSREYHPAIGVYARVFK